MQFKCKTSLHDLRGRVDIAKYMVYIIFLCTIGLFAIWLGDTFFSLTNILNITRQTAMISVMAVAMVFVIATGGIPDRLRRRADLRPALRNRAGKDGQYVRGHRGGASGRHADRRD